MRRERNWPMRSRAGAARLPGRPPSTSGYEPGGNRPFTDSSMRSIGCLTLTRPSLQGARKGAGGTVSTWEKWKDQGAARGAADDGASEVRGKVAEASDIEREVACAVYLAVVADGNRFGVCRVVHGGDRDRAGADLRDAATRWNQREIERAGVALVRVRRRYRPAVGRVGVRPRRARCGRSGRNC